MSFDGLLIGICDILGLTEAFFAGIMKTSPQFILAAAILLQPADAFSIFICWIPFIAWLFPWLCPDPCNGVQCGQGAQCVDGDCECFPMFEGNADTACVPVAVLNPFSNSFPRLSDFDEEVYKLASPEDSGDPLSTMPGIKSITWDELSKLSELPINAFFLIDTPYVPHDLAEWLHNDSLQLLDNGILADLNGDNSNTTMLLQHSVYEVIPPPERRLYNRSLGYPERFFRLYTWGPHYTSHTKWYNGCTEYRAFLAVQSVGPSLKPTNIHSLEVTASIQHDNGNWINGEASTCRNCNYRKAETKYEKCSLWLAHGVPPVYFEKWAYDYGFVPMHRVWGHMS